jgi:hypothetical protein
MRAAVRLRSDDPDVSVFGPVDPLRAFGALRAAVARLVRAARADHGTLNERTQRTYGVVMTNAFLHAAVAPSRRIRPGTGDELADRAGALAGALGLPTVPYLAGADSHRFAEIHAGGSQIRSLTVTRSGVLEMLWALEQVPTAHDALAVRAVDACTQLARFARLVSGEDYGRLLATSRWRRRVHSRVDWMLGVAVSTAGSTGEPGWRDILVVGEQPDRASGHAYGFMSPYGYGTDRLRGAKRSLELAAIVTVMLEEWLRANGYLHTTDAVEATVAAAITATAI